MKAASIDYAHIKQSPLVMKADFKGEVKHELEDEHSIALAGIEFDPDQDSIAYIGTQIEKVEGASQMTLPGDVEAPLAKGSDSRPSAEHSKTRSNEIKSASAETLKRTSAERLKRGSKEKVHLKSQQHGKGRTKSTESKSKTL
ncbi:unnamed protein product [Strongylus vulgaris]|uniref:Uncharacterized protein n=1 Tax=Strongylus vulgaris TaxID=40348 RepID=A0A3P7JNY6_STRVU|nr:unnamed protein product [Strongylus vulgaris]